MAWNLPNFNVNINCWFPGNVPATHGFDFGAKGQLYIPKEFSLVSDFGQRAWANNEVVVEWRVSTLTISLFGGPVVGAIIGAYPPTLVMVYYKVFAWEWKHLQFPNVYAVLICSQCDNTGTSPDPGR